MPVASALKAARAGGPSFIRPIGMPRKIVAPAMAPSRRMWPVLTV